MEKIFYLVCFFFHLVDEKDRLNFENYFFENKPFTELKNIHKNLFLCFIQNIYISKYFECDGKADCPNEEDELNCKNQTDLVFYCSDNLKINIMKVCDYLKNCPDGLDEENCGNYLGLIFN